MRQRIVRHVGIADDPGELLRLRELSEYLIVQMESERQPDLFDPAEKVAAKLASSADDSEEHIPVNLKNLREEKRVIKGISDVYGKIYNELGFDNIITGKHNATVRERIKHMVLARIAQPASKRSSVALLENDFGISLSLDAVYRSMDAFTDIAIERMQKSVFNATQQLLPIPAHVVFYDCTTLYFESFEEDELKQNGYSKDGKFNQAQVLLAMMVTPEGLPLGYELFPGSTFEGHTLRQALLQLKERFNLERVVFVADRGLLSHENLTLLETCGLEYVVGARLKSLPKKSTTTILDHTQYQDSKDRALADRIMEFSHKNRRILVSYNEKRARKDQHDRDEAIAKLKKKLAKSKQTKSLVSNSGYRKFLQMSGESTLTVDENKIADAARWDGLQGFITNIRETPVEEILSHYRSLWHIEEAFRVTKHHLEARPIYHWSPRRIRAHIAICYMAFACVTHLRYRVSLQKERMSVDVIRNALMHAQISILKDIKTGDRFAVPSNTSPQADQIYRAMGMRWSDVPYRLP